MNKKIDELYKRLLETFKIEAEEHIKTVSSGLLELEKKPSAKKQAAIIETIFREVHSLKGAAQSVSMTDIETISRSLESVFSAWKSQEISPSIEQFDILHSAIDTIGKLLFFPQEGRIAISELEQRLAGLMAGESVDMPDHKPLQPRDEAPPPKVKKTEVEEKKYEYPVESPPETIASISQHYPSAEEKPAMIETIRISTAKLDSLLLQVEEMLTAKITLSQRSEDFWNVLSMLDQWKKEWAKIYPEILIIRYSLEKEQKGKRQIPANLSFVKLMEFLDWNLSYIKSLEDKLTTLDKLSEQDRRSLGSMVDNLLEDMKKVLMLPFSMLLEIFPKLVRDLCREQVKEAELVLKGSEIEIDRRIMEEIKDPLIHLVRNCIDHGIEKPEVRESNKKQTQGTITISISRANSNKIEILVSDDGSGVDMKKVKKAAVKRGIISEKEINNLTKQEILPFIFESGISTSSIITDISGRGLGLAIVKEKVEKLGGTISLETKPGIGTSIKMLLPITLATFRGVLVQADNQIFITPSSNVEQVLKIKREDIKTVENKATIPLNGHTIPLVRLDDVLELTRKQNVDKDSEFIPILILGTAEKRIAFSVDEILNEQEVLVKGFGRQLSRVRNIASATVLGTGKVVPILNVSDLMKSAVKVTSTRVRPTVSAEENKVKRKSILVVEDSITARTLLKNILEMAGYHVKTAVDGVDAFTLLRTEEFDLVVSDVDMPRMNGFVLTSKIRSEKKIAELPVVLVTALESRDDRERGIDVGANAYILKSKFDQSNLLEVIRRLI